MCDVNLLLLDPAEVADDGTAVLTDRRAEHLRAVLQVAPGRTLQAGLVDGPIGKAEVLEVRDDSVRVRAVCNDPPPTTSDMLLLAIPRPKSLLRMLELAATLGFAEIVLFRSWRVDKSHLESQAMDLALQRHHLRLGLEQARRTTMPRVRSYLRFKPFVEDELPLLALPTQRFCAHPSATDSTASIALSPSSPFAVAVGPEGGLLPYEVDHLARAGFLPVRMSQHPLRSESALAAMHAQLDLLRARAR